MTKKMVVQPCYFPIIGTHQETYYVDEWSEKTVSKDAISRPKDFKSIKGQQLGNSSSLIKAGETKFFKARIQFGYRAIEEFYVEAIGDQGGYGHLDPWFSSNYKYRKIITIDVTKVSGGANLSNFPVLISSTDNDLRTTANGGKAASGSGEFVFTSSDAVTVLPHEIESYTATSGNIIAWVNVTTLSGTVNTVLYLYYGGPSSGATNQNPTGVWDTNYKGVWHLGNGTSLNDDDSTSNAYPSAATGIDAVAGKVDGAGGWAGGTDVIDVTSYTNFARPMSFELWVRNSVNSGTFLQASTYTNNFLVYHRNNTNVCLFVSLSDEFCYDVDITADNIFHHLVFTIASDGTRAIYFDGTAVTINHLAGTTSAPNTSTALKFGNGFTANTTRMDEIRISNTVRSAAWIKTEYNNQSSPSTFYTMANDATSIILIEEQ